MTNLSIRHLPFGGMSLTRPSPRGSRTSPPPFASQRGGRRRVAHRPLPGGSEAAIFISLIPSVCLSVCACLYRWLITRLIRETAPGLGRSSNGFIPRHIRKGIEVLSVRRGDFLVVHRRRSKKAEDLAESLLWRAELL